MDKQARLLEFGEDVKKKLCFLSEVVPDGTVKRSLPSSLYGLRRDKCGFVRHFFGKKMADPPSLQLWRDKERGIRHEGLARSEREHRRPLVEKRRATHKKNHAFCIMQKAIMQK